MPEGVAGGFENLAGVALVEDLPESRELVRFLLSDEAQRYFAEETFEYRVVADPSEDETDAQRRRTAVDTCEADSANVTNRFSHSAALGTIAE